ncbi:hypothetical protein N7510_007466 [Penicillium lagena]|uniref:uncharacterized protein n=1 Tax=Penicillium lagena TaxID=94218 RepID=UPI002540DB23|nr:uncharacterized protein N7510_007466 [Penicillium lagena]KAJ5610747.1 hypothetical protein N7510_007466 [Penicillium lagena]
MFKDSGTFRFDRRRKLLPKLTLWRQSFVPLRTELHLASNPNSSALSTLITGFYMFSNGSALAAKAIDIEERLGYVRINTNVIDGETRSLEKLTCAIETREPLGEDLSTQPIKLNGPW